MYKITQDILSIFWDFFTIINLSMSKNELLMPRWASIMKVKSQNCHIGPFGVVQRQKSFHEIVKFKRTVRTVFNFFFFGITYLWVLGVCEYPMRSASSWVFFISLNNRVPDAYFHMENIYVRYKVTVPMLGRLRACSDYTIYYMVKDRLSFKTADFNLKVTASSFQNTCCNCVNYE